MRLCTKCGKRRPLQDFNKNPGMADGYLNQCKDCRRVYLRDYRERNRSKIALRQRTWERQPQNKIKLAERMRVWKSANPDRRKAQVMTNNAIRDGRLTRLPCIVCGAKAHAHHADYSRPLDITWLCPAHHMQVHAAAT